MDETPRPVPDPERHPYPFTRSPIPWWILSIVFLLLLATALLWGTLALGGAAVSRMSSVAEDLRGVDANEDTRPSPAPR